MKLLKGIQSLSYTIVHAVLWNTPLIFLFKGEPGLPGLRGPEGAPGIGIQGEKVRISY